MRQEVWLAQVDAERLLEASLRQHSFQPYSKFPTVERDFSLLVPEGVTYNQLHEALRGMALEEMQDFRPVDFQRVGKIAAGAYSLLLRVTFQSKDRTLSGEEIAEATRKVLGALEPLGVRVRA